MNYTSLRTVEIECTIERESPKAWLIDTGYGTEWIPKRAGKMALAADGQGFVLTMDRRLAEEKGLLG